jgi:SNF2 family DNA or RNA helicase
MYKDISKYLTKYEYYVRRYSSANKSLTEKYLRYLRDIKINDKTIENHELLQYEFDNFNNKYVRKNITNKAEINEFNMVSTRYVYIFNSAMGKAIGKIIPKRRVNMYSDIIRDNHRLLIGIINNSIKKTCIFTQYYGLVKVLESFLDSYNISYVTVTGRNPGERADLISRFKLDDSIQVIIATNQVIGVGVTLVEANTMLVFGTPWRQTDMNQLTDRIHRIGQTDDCYIYDIYLDTEDKNLSDRTKEILDWSNNMTSTYIDEIRT